MMMLSYSISSLYVLCMKLVLSIVFDAQTKRMENISIGDGDFVVVVYFLPFFVIVSRACEYICI